MSIYDNTAPFGNLITPGVVSIRLHTCCTFQAAHLYDTGVIRKALCYLSCQFSGNVGKTDNFESHFRPLIIIRS